jgi:hypothetical protein
MYKYYYVFLSVVTADLSSGVPHCVKISDDAIRENICKRETGNRVKCGRERKKKNTKNIFRRNNNGRKVALGVI